MDTEPVGRRTAAFVINFASKVRNFRSFASFAKRGASLWWRREMRICSSNASRPSASMCFHNIRPRRKRSMVKCGLKGALRNDM